MRIHDLARTAELLRGSHLKRHSVEAVRELLAPIVEVHERVLLDLGPGTIVHRARKCTPEHSFFDLPEMIYPPSERATIGRANLAKKPTLYASANEHTAFDEIGASPGEKIQLIAIRPLPGDPILSFLVGEYQSVFNSGSSLVNSRKIEQFINFRIQTSSLEAKYEQLFADSFLAEAFRRNVKRPHDYLTTAVFSDGLFAQGMSITYPSVETPHGINVAIPMNIFDTRCEVIATQVVEITDYFGYGIYRWNQVAVSSVFDNEGKVSWFPPLTGEAERTGVQPASPGWRVKREA